MWMKTGEGRNIAILIVKLDPLYLHQCQSCWTYNRIILINGVCGRIFNSWMVTKRSSLCCFCAYVMVEISTMALFKGPWPRPQKQLIGHRVHSRGVERNVLGSNKAQHRLSSHSKSNGHRLLPWWFLFWRTERNKLQTTILVTVFAQDYRYCTHLEMFTSWLLWIKCLLDREKKRRLICRRLNGTRPKCLVGDWAIKDVPFT